MLDKALRSDSTIIEIRPVAPNDSEIWPENGFVSLPGELVYYDATEKNETGKIIRLVRCVRAYEGEAADYPKGTPLYGNAVAEHHNQLALAIANIEATIGDLVDAMSIGESSAVRSIAEVDGEFSMNMAAAMNNIVNAATVFDDACPDVEFVFNVLNPTNAEFCVRIFGPYTSYRLDFGDGSHTTTEYSGTHTYSGGTMNPYVTVTSDKCCIVQQPNKSYSDGMPFPTVESVNPLVVTIPEVPDFPTFVAPRPVCPGQLFNLPPMMIQNNCLECQAPVSSVSKISETTELCTILVSIVGCCIPSRISIVGCCPPSRISIVGCCPPSQISIVGCCPPSRISIVGCCPPSRISIVGGCIPSRISIVGCHLPSQISIVGCCPSQISIVGCCPPSVITIVGACAMPSRISIVDCCSLPSQISLVGCCPPSQISLVGAEAIPRTISVTVIGSLPTLISIVGCCPPSVISFVGGCIPSVVSFATPPSFSPICFCPVPSFSPIQFALAPTIGPILFAKPPSFSPICFCPTPSFSPIQFGTPPSVTVNWGTPPTLSCIVTMVCPTSDTPTGMAMGFAGELDEGIPVTFNEDIGIPTEIKVIVPKFDDVRLAHDLPKYIEVKAAPMPDIRIIGPEKPLPEKIKIVHNIPKQIHLVADGVPTSIKLDATDIPRSIRVETGPDFPSIMRLEAIGIPDSIQVVGFPKTIEVVHNIPSAIKLEMPENPVIRLEYGGGPIPLMLPPEMAAALKEIMIAQPGK